MPAAVTITAPSRLHFGLMNFGGEQRQFGGVGVMIDRPGIELRITPAADFSCNGALAERAAVFARRWQAYHGCKGALGCALEVVQVPREHTGLGVGTQLAMAVAQGLSSCFGLPSQTPMELATSVGRGQRSAVGAYGFVMGGLIAERGKLPGERFSPLDAHLDLPTGWRFILSCPRNFVGLANEDEARAFRSLPPVPREISDELARIARDRLLPAAARGDFEQFSDSVYEYGRLSGNCFSPLQGGPYNGPILTAIVESWRQLGVAGVGQSSWGPTIFALANSQAAADGLVARWRQQAVADDVEITIAAASPQGAVVSPG